jgi:hypothetical protein
MNDPRIMHVESTSQKPIALFQNKIPDYGIDEYALFSDTLKVTLRNGRPSSKIETYILKNLSPNYAFHPIRAIWIVLCLIGFALLAAIIAGRIAINRCWALGRVEVDELIVFGCIGFLIILIIWMVYRVVRRSVYICTFPGKPGLVIVGPQENADELLQFAKVVARQVTLVHSGRVTAS